MVRTGNPRWQRLTRAAERHGSTCVVAHNNPDPDAIASAWAVTRLIGHMTATRPSCIAGGGVTRADNREMLRLLNPPIEFVGEYDPRPDELVVFVDCQPAGGNHPVRRFPPPSHLAVIDHHPVKSAGSRLAYRDIRPHAAATASIATSYLRSADLSPGRELATALLHAVRTEVAGGETSFGRLDRQAIRWLTPEADPSAIATIQQAPLPVAYIADVIAGLQAAERAGDTVFCNLPHVSGPDLVGETADLLIRCEGIHRVLAVAEWRGKLYLSARVTDDGTDASQLLRSILPDAASAGGHQRRAGAQVPLNAESPDCIIADIRSQWFHVIGHDARIAQTLLTP